MLTKEQERRYFEYCNLYREEEQFDIYAFAYTHYQMTSQNLTAQQILEETKKNEPLIYRLLSELEPESYEKNYDKVKEQYSLSDLQSFLIEGEEIFQTNRRAIYHKTPDNLIKLIQHLVSDSSRRDIADFTSGRGNSILRLGNKGFESLTLVEREEKNAAISAMKLKVIYPDRMNDIEIQVNDLNNYSEVYGEKKFDLIFSHCPWGDRTSNQSEWRFIELAMNHLKETGQAFLCVPCGIEHRKAFEELKERFIEKGFIHRVIQLPERYYSYTAIPSLLLELSFGNQSIDFIDASQMHIEGRNGYYFSDQDIQTIIDPEFSKHKEVPCQEVLETGRLLPSYYLLTPIEDARPLGELADVLRGSDLKKKDLEDLKTDELTSFQLIRSSGLNNGLVAEVTSLTDLPESPVLLEDKDVLITRVSSSLGIAIYQAEEGVQSIVDQSLLVIRARQQSLNPYYLIAYLQSELGQEQLQAVYSSGAIKQASVKSLRELPVPKATIQEQEHWGRLIERKLEQISQKILELELALEDYCEESNRLFKE
ncbi:N-6 DNA methylase [Aerococcus sanguinicola]|uniref:N-6 DNA methylase n=1 Tax=unclassified Aerococcus TaxID=2618060 RepID=UPI0008A2F060|nr:MULTISPECIES: N-6 DNA methylase [unclassified Aerococcus]KAB0647397.1 N-6 DNA methylase [Aerococcus sanguinicola]MDK6233139.1 N-6 DNA methylase [Aerococcus sp. UMB10185]MDK6855654.1 N-6 DNA methylase [Aerococcus sp. UMB7533]OFN00344.1 hypothetical protein HMPREF2626_09690 [Aerococcus sp. HMSC062A02]OHO44958.1 hypothetical protein HMPREF2705_06180 [Aerococcus sp. HMSC035B07]